MKYLIDTDAGTCVPYEEEIEYDELSQPTLDPVNRNGYDWLDKVTQSNGVVYHPGRDYNRGSGNQDLGDPVLVVADGIVTYTEKRKTGFGNHIFVKHSINHKTHGEIVFWSHYAHLDEIQVKVDEEVISGDQIGTVGKTGTKYAHLHFELRQRPQGVNYYPVNRSKAWVKNNYYSPDEFLS